MEIAKGPQETVRHHRAEENKDRTVLVNESLQKGVESLTEAIRLDAQGNVSGALATYEKALFYLELSLKAESDVAKSALIMQKLSEYNGRVEVLRETERKRMKIAKASEVSDITFDDLDEEFLDFGESLEVLGYSSGKGISLEDRVSSLSTPLHSIAKAEPLKVGTNGSPGSNRPTGFTVPPSFTSSASSPNLVFTLAAHQPSLASSQPSLAVSSPAIAVQAGPQLPYGHPGHFTTQASFAIPTSYPPPLMRSQSTVVSSSSSMPTFAPSSSSSQLSPRYSQEAFTGSQSSALVVVSDAQRVMDLVQSAAQMVTEARAFESNGQTAQALHLYHTGIAQIMQAIQIEPDYNLKQVLRAKTHFLLTHAEDLKASQTPKLSLSSVAATSVEIAEDLARRARGFYDKASHAQSAELYDLAISELRGALDREDTVEAKKWLGERLYIMEAAAKGATTVMKYAKFIVPYPYSLIFSVPANIIKKTGAIDKASREIEAICNPEAAALKAQANAIDDIFSDSPSTKKKGKGKGKDNDKHNHDKDKKGKGNDKDKKKKK